MFSLFKGTLPSPLMNMITPNSTVHTHNTRNLNNPHVQSRRTNIAARNIRHNGAEIWYKIPVYIKEAKTLKSFTYKLKKNIYQCCSLNL